MYDDPQSVTAPTTPRAVHLAILLSVTVAVTGATLVSAFHDSSAGIAAKEVMGLSDATPDIATKVNELLTAASTANQTEYQRVIESFVARNSPGILLATAKALLANDQKAQGSRLAMELAEAGAKRYQNVSLYFLLASQYVKSQDFEEANRILALSLLESEPEKNFLIGLMFADPAYRDFDADKAKSFFKIAADANFGPAIRKINEGL